MPTGKCEPRSTWHEGVQGYRHQKKATQIEWDLPLLRNFLFFNAYREGRALRAERLGRKLGAHNDNLFGNGGRPQVKLLRAVRQATDTGYLTGML